MKTNHPTFLLVLIISVMLCQAFCDGGAAWAFPTLMQPVSSDKKCQNLKGQEEDCKKQLKIEELEKRVKELEKVPGKLTNKHAAEVVAANLELLAARMHQPSKTVAAAKAGGQAQATGAGNDAGDIARDQAITAIDYASRFLKNFTTEKGNKWNQLRDQIFVPMAILLLLPGAVLAQVRAIIAAGSPVIGHVGPFEGIQRSLIAIFLIPGTYLIVNYSIDLANSIQYTISTEYRRIFGTDMYKDAMCAQIRAFGVRYIPENEGSLKVPAPDLSARNNGPFSKAEGRLWGKLTDPCVGLNLVPKNRDDASMPSSSIAARLMMNASNAGINTAWAILCAFQMAFFYYLYFVGPIMAALWVWPMKQFRDAFPSWVEGVVTLLLEFVLALTNPAKSNACFTDAVARKLSALMMKSPVSSVPLKQAIKSIVVSGRAEGCGTG